MTAQVLQNGEIAKVRADSFFLACNSRSVQNAGNGYLEKQK